MAHLVLMPGDELLEGLDLGQELELELTVVVTEILPQVTHGRHCPCTPCSRQDWSEPGLAPCGMHGPECPAEYAPLGKGGSPSSLANLTVIRLDVCQTT